LALSLSACAVLGKPSDTPHMAAGKALTDVAHVLKGAADVADTATKEGLIHGQTAATISQDFKWAQQLMNDAASAYKLSQDNTVQADVAAVTTLAAQIVVLVSQAKGAN
jgi:hypothetical protein